MSLLDFLLFFLGMLGEVSELTIIGVSFSPFFGCVLFQYLFLFFERRKTKPIENNDDVVAVVGQLFGIRWNQINDNIFK
jgi:hypothetical protein